MNWTFPSTWLLTVWVLWLLMGLWGWQNVYMFLRKMRRHDERQEESNVVYEPRAAVIVPIKGVDDRFEEHLKGLTEQDYPHYRLLFVVESDQDPAHAALTARGQVVVVAGESTDQGQKIHNQLAAMRLLTPEDEALVFTDADAVTSAQWLRRLVRPLMKERVGMTTSYRWLVPVGGRFVDKVASVINAQAATLAGPGWRNQAWGGSMAIMRSTAEEGRLIEHLRGALCDDYRFAACVRSLGKEVYFVHRCMVATPVRFTWGDFIAFGRRQYLHTRVYGLWLWIVAAIGTGFYAFAWLTAALALLAWGMLWALFPMAGMLYLNIQRANLRRQVMERVFSPEWFEKLRPTLWIDRFLTPLCMAVHCGIILSTMTDRYMYWSGIKYRIYGPQTISVVERKGKPVVAHMGQPAPADPPPPGPTSPPDGAG